LLSSAFASYPVKHSLHAGAFIINPWPRGNGAAANRIRNMSRSEPEG